MFRGHLRFFVLHALAEKDMAGYRLMKTLGEELGDKPSPGTIYPLLEHLKEEKLVTCKACERKKVYSITKEGKDFLKHTLNAKQEMVEKLQRMHCLLEPEQAKNNDWAFKVWKQNMPRTLVVAPEVRSFMKALFQKIEEKKSQAEIKSFLKQKTQELKSL
ncbi:MAG: PadR family transcriptional regulator [archaeon]